MNSSFFLVLWGLSLLVAPLYSSSGLVKDNIVLIVGDNIVLKSDLDFELNFYKTQQNLSKKEVVKLKKDLLEERIKNLVIVELAKKDTNIVVDYMMVEEALD